jgi:hypothetical protein
VNGQDRESSYRLSRDVTGDSTQIIGNSTQITRNSTQITRELHTNRGVTPELRIGLLLKTIWHTNQVHMTKPTKGQSRANRSSPKSPAEQKLKPNSKQWSSAICWGPPVATTKK